MAAHSARCAPEGPASPHERASVATKGAGCRGGASRKRLRRDRVLARDTLLGEIRGERAARLQTSTQRRSLLGKRGEPLEQHHVRKARERGGAATMVKPMSSRNESRVGAGGAAPSGSPLPPSHAARQTGAGRVDRISRLGTLAGASFPTGPPWATNSKPPSSCAAFSTGPPVCGTEGPARAQPRDLVDSPRISRRRRTARRRPASRRRATRTFRAPGVRAKTVRERQSTP